MRNLLFKPISDISVIVFISIKPFFMFPNLFDTDYTGILSAIFVARRI